MSHHPPTPDEEKRYAELQQMALDFARSDDRASLEPMIQAGLPVNLADHKGNTLLMLAAYHGNLETVRMLIGAGAQVDQRNDRGQTPLGGVAFKGYADVAELLLEAGADPNADNGGGSTPLLYARMFGRSEVARILESRGGGMGSRRMLSVMARLVGIPIRLFRHLSRSKG